MNTTANRAEEIAHAVAVDTEVARLYDLYWEVQIKIQQLGKDIESMAGRANMKHNQIPERQAEYAARIAKIEDQINDLRPEAQARQDAAVEYNEKNYGGWPRFFHVVHIHKSMHCSSFRPTTRVGWLPKLSGRTEAEAVAEQGESLCTICYPSAPVALTQKQADPNACAGSGKTYSKEYSTGRERSYYGAAGYCPECLRWQAVTKAGVMRKHKPNDETRRHATDVR